jgi:hypothetical protein
MRATACPTRRAALRAGQHARAAGRSLSARDASGSRSARRVSEPGPLQNRELGRDPDSQCDHWAAVQITKPLVQARGRRIDLTSAYTTSRRRVLDQLELRGRGPMPGTGRGGQRGRGAERDNPAARSRPPGCPDPRSLSLSWFLRPARWRCGLPALTAEAPNEVLASCRACAWVTTSPSANAATPLPLSAIWLPTRCC